MKALTLCCLAEQAGEPALKRLPEDVILDARPLADLVRDGWTHPLILIGSGLDDPDVASLLRRAYRAGAPLLVLPPLPIGDVAPLLDAPAPVVVTHRRANQVDLVDEVLRDAAGRERVAVYCTEMIETALQTGILATADGKPVVWAYRPTRAATPVVWVAPQVLLASARTDPMDREALLAALIAWAEAQARPSDAGERKVAGVDAHPADPALLRAMVVAWAVRPDLDRQTLADWLARRLLVQTNEASLEAALAALRADGALSVDNKPQVERWSALAQGWGLRAWIREARRLEESVER